MGRIGLVRDYFDAMIGRDGSKTVGIGAAYGHNELPTHAITDTANGTGHRRLVAIDERQQALGIVNHVIVGQRIHNLKHLVTLAVVVANAGEIISIVTLATRTIVHIR